MSESDPHRGQTVLTLGPAPAAARLTMIMVHGRGASAEDMLGLATEFATTDVAYLAPQAAGATRPASTSLRRPTTCRGD